MEIETRQKTIVAIIQVLADNGCCVDEAKALLKATERIIGKSALVALDKEKILQNKELYCTTYELISGGNAQ